MFSDPASKLDMFAELNAGKLILINTAKSVLKENGTEIFGRFFIALIAQAAQERTTLPQSERTPTLVYIDEAQDYFDPTIGTILSQARKYRVGMVMAHQYLGQLSSGLAEAVEANTSIKLAGGVSARDARTLSGQMNCDPGLIQRQSKGSFATYIRGYTDRAVSMAFPFFVMEKMPRQQKRDARRLCNTRAISTPDHGRPARKTPNRRRTSAMTAPLKIHRMIRLNHRRSCSSGLILAPMNAKLNRPPTSRELRWLQHIAVHGPQSSEFLLELCADTHRCRDTGKRNLQRLRETGWLRLPSQQRQIAKADFNPHVYDLTRQSIRYLEVLDDPATVRPTGHWWHTFLTASVTSAISIAATRRGFSYIPAHDILNRKGATLAIPLRGRQQLISDQLFALNYGTGFRSFVLEVDRGTEPYQSGVARKSVARMLEHYAEMFANDIARTHYGLRSPLLLLMVFACPARAAKVLTMMEQHPVLHPVGLVASVPFGFPRYAAIETAVSGNWQRSGQRPFTIFTR